MTFFALKLAENSPAKYLCFSLGTPCRGVRAKKERDEEEDCRRSRSTQERHSGPGWSPVNLLLILLSAQIFSEDVLDPTSLRFLPSFDGARNRPPFLGSLLHESSVKRDKQKCAESDGD